MRFGSRRMILGALGTVMVCLLARVLANGQAAQEAKPQMAEEVFTNVTVLKGIPVDEFMDTMGMFSASTNMNCTDCHTSDSGTSWAKFADDTALKRTARRMVLMVNALNKANFGGARAVTCYTCHRGDQRPKVVPSFAIQYGSPVDDPNEVEIPAQPFPGTPSADQIFAKYIQALGGAQRLAALTSFVAKGTWAGYDTDHAMVPLDIYAKAPGQRTVIVHSPFGDSVRTFDGRAGWIAAPDKPVLLMPLTGGNLYGAKVDGMLSFPAQIKQSFTRWRVALTTIDDKEVQVLQGTTTGQPTPVNLYFDETSGLLVRMVRFADTAIGRVPTQIDFSDYRDVAGVKMPFHWVLTWTDGQATVELTNVQPNVAIDAARFGKPAPAAPPKVQ